MSSLFCKHRNKQINVNSIDTCSHITHLQSATLQSTFSTIASLRKLNYVEQLCRVQSNPPHLNLITAWENYAQQTDITRVCVQLHKCSG